MVTDMGFEPMLYGVKGRRVNRSTNPPYWWGRKDLNPQSFHTWSTATPATNYGLLPHKKRLTYTPQGGELNILI